MSREVFKYLQNTFSTDQNGEHYDNTSNLTVGTVVDTGDPLEQGRLRIFCPAFGDNPKKLGQLQWAVYVTPYGGTINNSMFARGPYLESSQTDGTVAYGFWAIPELGAQVLVGCIDGDIRRRFWSGCVYPHQEIQTLFSGRFSYSSSGVNGPLSSSGSQINPLYINLAEAFNNKVSSAEWQTRGVEYQISKINSGNAPPTPDKSEMLDSTFADIQRAAKYSWVTPIVGNTGYDWSGFKNIRGMKASRTVGLSTPGFHSFMMDDRPFNSRIKVRTSSGTTLLMDDTNERIYLATAKGKNFLEMDFNGNVDVYSGNRLSFYAEEDINFCAGGSIRLTGGTGIYGYAGTTPPLTSTLQTNPVVGEIRFQSESDFSIISNNLRSLSFASSIFEIGKDLCMSVADNFKLESQNSVNVIANQGQINLNSGTDTNILAMGALNAFGNTMANISTIGSFHLISFSDSVNIGARQNVAMRSISGGIAMQALGSGNQSASVSIKTPSSQINFDSSGINAAATGNIAFNSAGGFSAQTTPSPPPLTPSTPPSSSTYPNASPQLPSNCSGLPSTLPADPSQYSGADLAARLAYNAGFRGQAWITATAIAGRESTYRVGVANTSSARSGPNPEGCGTAWTGAFGLWQIRRLEYPEQCGPPDNGRIANLLTDPAYNATMAYKVYSEHNNFLQWQTYTDGSYNEFIDDANNAIASICSSYQAQRMEYINSSIEKMSTPEVMPLTLGVGVAGIQFGATNFTLQHPMDIGFITTIANTSIIESYYDTVNLMLTAISTLANAVSVGVNIPAELTSLNLAASFIGADLIGNISFGGFVDDVVTNIVSGVAGNLTVQLSNVFANVAPTVAPHIVASVSNTMNNSFSSYTTGLPQQIGTLSNSIQSNNDVGTFIQGNISSNTSNIAQGVLNDTINAATSLIENIPAELTAAIGDLIVNQINFMTNNIANKVSATIIGNNLEATLNINNLA